MKNFIFNFIVTSILFLVINQYVGLNFWHYVLMLVLFQPYRIRGSIYSFFDGINNSHDNVYSLFGIFQKANGACVSLFGICFYQKGEECFQLLGITIYKEPDFLEGLKGYSLNMIEKNNGNFFILGRKIKNKNPTLLE